MTDVKDTPKGFIKVVSPDHPFTFDGPDILLSDTAGLIAVFKIRPNEEKNQIKLISRLTNSLIAYPAETQMLLLLDSKTEDSYSRFEKSFFSKLIEEKDLRKSRAILRDKKPSFILKEIKQIQRRLFNTQSQIQRDNVDYIRKTKFERKEITEIKELKNKATYYDKYSQKEVVVKANIYEYENSFYGSKKLSNSSSDIVELRPYYEFSINKEFSVDNGVPYFKHISRKALNLNEVPRIRFDPIKPIRVASLFGWYLANANQLSELENRIPKYFRSK